MQPILVLMKYNFPFILRKTEGSLPQEAFQWILSSICGHQCKIANQHSLQQHSKEFAVRVWPEAELLLEFYFQYLSYSSNFQETFFPFISLRFKMHIFYFWNCLFMSVFLTWICTIGWHCKFLQDKGCLYLNHLLFLITQCKKYIA